MIHNRIALDWVLVQAAQGYSFLIGPTCAKIAVGRIINGGAILYCYLDASLGQFY